MAAQVVPVKVHWIGLFLLRLILFSPVQVIDAVTGACSQIFVHLSEPLYDMVLNMVFDYASTNVRTNAVRAIHQLVECVANADPVKTLSKFFTFCARNIRNELQSGASSLRTTSSSTPLPSDATLHWSKLVPCHPDSTWIDWALLLDLAILRGCVYKCVAILFFHSPSNALELTAMGELSVISYLMRCLSNSSFPKGPQVSRRVDVVNSLASSKGALQTWLFMDRQIDFKLASHTNPHVSSRKQIH